MIRIAAALLAAHAVLAAASPAIRHTSEACAEHQDDLMHAEPVSQTYAPIDQAKNQAYASHLRVTTNDEHARAEPYQLDDLYGNPVYQMPLGSGKPTDPTVRLDDGMFTGKSKGNSAHFLGIPFAEPPCVATSANFPGS
jgi:hypothetical protein